MNIIDIITQSGNQSLPLTDH